MKKKLVIVSSLGALVLPLFLVVIIMGAFAGSASSNGQAKGLQTKLTAKEVAQKANISEERASDVIKILNYELSQEQFTIAGASGSLAVAERESGFDPKAVNTGGWLFPMVGLVFYYQWQSLVKGKTKEIRF